MKRVVDLSNEPAWQDFYRGYQRFVRRRCSLYGLDSHAVDELCSLVWFKLVRRIPSYCYDPSGSFRGWLKRLCHNCAIDYFKERKHQLKSLGEELLERLGSERSDEEQNVGSPLRDAMFCEASEVQIAVRRRVKLDCWTLFWRVVIEGEKLSIVAKELGVRYPTAFAAVKRVMKLLREEGERRRLRLSGPDAAADIESARRK